MSAVARVRPTDRLRFKHSTPPRVIQEIARRYRQYVIALKGAGELEKWFETDIAREVGASMTPDKALRHLREMSDLTLAEVGARVGVSAQRVADWEAGRRGIGKNKAKALAGLFNVNPALLI